MPFRTPPVLRVFLLAAVLAGPAAAAQPAASATPVGLAAEASQQLVDFLQDEMRERQIPGMQVAVIRQGKVVLARNFGVASLQYGVPVTQDSLGVDATGAVNGKPIRLHGRFEARGERFYQVIVLGPADAVPAEQVDQFLSSFTLQ